mmetsp:Transcript_13733/g.29723  ORF Transcript_13733/g.29723 Transcript_13733/m.29723 type:complete len:287 (+) Transcript_13733:454-1314(+)
MCHGSETLCNPLLMVRCVGHDQRRHVERTQKTQHPPLKGCNGRGGFVLSSFGDLRSPGRLSPGTDLSFFIVAVWGVIDTHPQVFQPELLRLKRLIQPLCFVYEVFAGCLQGASAFLQRRQILQHLVRRRSRVRTHPRRNPLHGSDDTIFLPPIPRQSLLRTRTLHKLSLQIYHPRGKLILMSERPNLLFHAAVRLLDLGSQCRHQEIFPELLSRYQLFLTDLRLLDNVGAKQSEVILGDPRPLLNLLGQKVHLDHFEFGFFEIFLHFLHPDLVVSADVLHSLFDCL